MLAWCPRGHEENLSHDEVIERLRDSDFECREDECNKKLSYEVDQVLWPKFLNTKAVKDARANLEPER